MSEITINAEIRKVLGKRVKPVRTAGKVPGIYYAHGQENIPLSMNELTLQPLFRTSATHVINLKLDDGSSHTCILKDIQFDPVTEKPVHFDLFGLNANEELTIEVPVVLKGIPQGVKDGGALQHVMHKLRVSCLPKNIPDRVEINVEAMKMNTSIHVKELSVPNVKILDNGSSTVVAVVPPTILKEPEPGVAVAAVEATAEPEVIARGKKPEEGVEGAAAPAEAGKEKKDEKKKEEKKEEKKK